MTPEERLIELETKVAFQEDTIGQLGDVLTRLEAQVHELRTAYRGIAMRLDEASGGMSASSEDEPPPHY